MCERPFIYKNKGSDYSQIYQMAFGKLVSNPKENIAQRLLVHNSRDLMENKYSYDSLVLRMFQRWEFRNKMEHFMEIC